MTLGAADDGTGVAGTEYRVDGGEWIQRLDDHHPGDARRL